MHFFIDNVVDFVDHQNPGPNNYKININHSNFRHLSAIVIFSVFLLFFDKILPLV